MITFQVKGFECIVDDDDADLSLLKWQPLNGKNCNTIYARRSVYDDKKHTELIHRVIMSRILGRPVKPHEWIDHEDLNGLNNRRSNLRLATRSQNMANRAVQSNNVAKVKGICRKNKGYQARITVNKTRIYLGMFPTPELAHEAYKQAAIKYFGEFARFE